MDLAVISKEWEKESNIDKNKLVEESLNIDSLHRKYYDILISERALRKKYEKDQHKLYLDRYIFYSGTPAKDSAFQEKYGPKKILKTEVDMFLNADEALIDIDNKIYLQEQKIDYLESIIKQIQKRSFNIKNSIEIIKFENGII